MRLSVQAKNVMLEALDESQAAGAKFGSLHNAYSATGTNELAGGSPAYARKGLSWAAAAAGVKNTSATAVFDIAGGSTVAFMGFWDAVSGGNFLGMTPNGGGPTQAFVADTGTEVLECVGHGFANNETVVVWSMPGTPPNDPLPGGLTEGAVYFVINATTDDLQLSLTQGGAAIDITSLGAGSLQKIVREVFGAQGTHTITTVAMRVD